MSEAASAPAKKPRTGVTAATIMLFAFLGPPIGGIIVWLGLLATDAMSSAYGQIAGRSTSQMDVGLGLLGLLIVLPFSYLIGLVPALIVGAIVAVWQNRRGPMTDIELAGLVIAAGAIYAALALANSDGRDDPVLAVALPFAVAAIPTLICGVIARRWRRLAPQDF